MFFLHWVTSHGMRAYMCVCVYVIWFKSRWEVNDKQTPAEFSWILVATCLLHPVSHSEIPVTASITTSFGQDHTHSIPLHKALNVIRTLFSLLGLYTQLSGAIFRIQDSAVLFLCCLAVWGRPLFSCCVLHVSEVLVTYLCTLKCPESKSPLMQLKKAVSRAQKELASSGERKSTHSPVRSAKTPSAFSSLL